MRQLEKYLTTKKEYQIIFIAFTILMLIALFLSLIKIILNIETNTSSSIRVSNYGTFFLGIFIAPLFETFIFQFLIGKIFLPIFKNILIVTFISAILFGLNHNYEWFYTFYSFIIGFYLTYLYFILLKLKLKAFLTVLILHSSYNLVVFINSII